MLNVHLGRGVPGQRKIPHVIIMFVSGLVRRWKRRKHAFQACKRRQALLSWWTQWMSSSVVTWS